MIACSHTSSAQPMLAGRQGSGGQCWSRKLPALNSYQTCSPRRRAPNSRQLVTHQLRSGRAPNGASAAGPAPCLGCTAHHITSQHSAAQHSTAHRVNTCTHTHHTQRKELKASPGVPQQHDIATHWMAGHEREVQTRASLSAHPYRCNSSLWQTGHLHPVSVLAVPYASHQASATPNNPSLT
jgi:hypothetical protein